ncbi:diaminobutyrate acetyltransferase [Microbulbifer thermotolerans]|uniref:diaminobutyrate acetyltransferase n=1 Tax=Microbulbifer thermotolerans TaxID=252514 RepID=UPI0008F196AC|nr:diaminobutyrate acetyltransferase [Microbulbifer thermotolerans]MCX2831577.1 diaminobutyrate acetyltransferase [Microbulbifer thermotolerans]MCX2835025.1 diaminobutyrate acetyltransferase [Microbulbifer thermotolerans]MCX2841678.1 diaminobutyrate acetyltransferase [Microbulbifer thermotolerans]WKT59861.1 diaminobutyrate acetyltransferase [Microbulbifer thermotolerans]SFC57683.1 L-2,4-diaminobutyric acid acetyltransferase [Microbulbifer thermotolerans]
MTKGNDWGATSDTTPSGNSVHRQGESPQDETGVSQGEKIRAQQGSVSKKVLLREPVSEDGAAVHRLISRCPPLDENSLYCNLLQASHFASTSVAAEVDRELVGFVSGYLIPQRPDTLFVWQVAVAEEVRGLGLAGRMVREILGRPGCGQVRHLETTITPDNAASWALFRGLARKLGSTCTEAVMFDRERHFFGLHDSEILLRIGPFSPGAVAG